MKQKSLRQKLAEMTAEVERLRKMARTPREPHKTSLGGVIQEIRESQTLGLQGLAKKSGVAAGLVCRIECKPESNPTFNNLVKIATALGVPLWEIVRRWEVKQK